MRDLDLPVVVMQAHVQGVASGDLVAARGGTGISGTEVSDICCGLRLTKQDPLPKGCLPTGRGCIRRGPGRVAFCTWLYLSNTGSGTVTV